MPTERKRGKLRGRRQNVAARERLEAPARPSLQRHDIDERYAKAVKLLEEGASYRKAAKQSRVGAERLRKHTRRLDLVEETRPQVKLKPQGAVREWFTYTTDGPKVLRLTRDEASRNGRYLNAARTALRQNKAKPLKPFANADPLTDVEGNEYIWETQLTRLKAMVYAPGGEPEYRLVR